MIGSTLATPGAAVPMWRPVVLVRSSGREGMTLAASAACGDFGCWLLACFGFGL
jgi:hypothetical protein